ncbi:MAG: SusC/RagA family TonB-linked outer membrane protein [Fidelibacterota bacterium]|nr:MAG: SusC/RagA family TonB-linked outer membrane protein [Candidatus Neomarinimicrobiota bacterium]
MTSRLLVLAFLITFPLVLSAQITTISGRVTDAVTEQPLPGANVTIEGTRLGTATDVNGNYRINLLAGIAALGDELTLKADFIGYMSQTATIVVQVEPITRNFELDVDVLELESVVVTGLGTQTKERLGVTISKVKAEEIVAADDVNLVSALAGKAPNVEIVKTSGEPGTNSYIRIRGGASIDRTTQPLFIVDGVPVDNSFNDLDFGGFGGAYAGSNVEYSNRAGDINNEDIASIEILKGSAAAAVFGSRASSGVVMITTKSGRPGKVQISFKSQYGVSEISKSYPLQRQWGQGSSGKASVTSSYSWGPKLDTVEVGKVVSGELYYNGKTYDHGTMYSDGGYLTDNNITVSGGNEFTTFFLSAGRYFEEGHWEAGSDYERTTARLKATQVVSEKLRLTGNLAYTLSNQNGIQRADNLSGIGIASLRSPPNFNPDPYLHPETGNHRSYRYQTVSRTKTLKSNRGFDNPYWIMYEMKNPSEVNRIQGYIKAQYDLTDWITLDYHLGADHSTDERANVLPPSTSREGGIGRIMKAAITIHEYDQNLTATIQGEPFLKDLGFVDATLMLGHNLNLRGKNELRTAGLDMGVPEGFDQVDNTVEKTVDEYQFRRAIEAFFGQLTVNLFDQFFITGALRNDGSSTFGKSQKRHWYPKASAAWEFTRALPIPGLNFGKLRMAYGVSGVQPGVYTTISTYKAESEGHGIYTNAQLAQTGVYSGVSGFRSSTTLGNDDIKPERTSEVEFGVDFSALNSRLGVEFTYYDQLTEDVIFDLNIAPSAGYFSQTQNAATITNKGVELSVNLTPIRQKNLTWDLGLIYAANKNKVTDMSGAAWEGLAAHNYAMEGEELGIIRTYSWMRFGYDLMYDLDGDDVKENIDSVYAGQWKKYDVYVGADGMPVMWEEDLLTPFSSNPKWTGSIRSELTLFGNLSVSAFIDIVKDRWMDNYGAGQLYRYGTHKITEIRDEEHPIEKFLHHGEKGVGPGAGVAFPTDQKWFQGMGGYSGDRWQYIENAGYVKLREIAVTYRLAGDFVRNLGLSNISLRLSGRNLKTWTEYTGYDPDTNRSQATNNRGVDYFNSPQTRVWSLTLRVNL